MDLSPCLVFPYTRLTEREEKRERERERERDRETERQRDRERETYSFPFNKTLTKKQLRILCEVGGVIQVSHS